MPLTRREVMEGLVGLFTATVLPSKAMAEDTTRKALLKPRWDFEQNGLDTLVRCADAYQENGPKPLPETITFLYPGSGTDTNVLEIGVQLLYDSPVRHARFIFTEIGEYDTMDFAQGNNWHQGRKDALHKIEKALSKSKPRIFTDLKKKKNRTSGWQNKNIANSSVTEFDLAVRTPHGPKKITLYFSYNTFVDREEPTEEEQRIFSRRLLENARGLYWPKKKEPGKMYPAYFLQSQFDEADIIISRLCGDLRLLQFDYVRAFHRTSVVKPRVVFTEAAGYRDGFLREFGRHMNPISRANIDESGDIDAVVASLPAYNIQRHLVDPTGSYGYCSRGRDSAHNKCTVDMLVVSKS